MTSLARKQIAEAVLSQLRGVGPQTVAQIREDLGTNKRETEDAIWYLMSMNRIEYASNFPTVYKASEELHSVRADLHERSQR